MGILLGQPRTPSSLTYSLNPRLYGNKIKVLPTEISKLFYLVSFVSQSQLFTRKKCTRAMVSRFLLFLLYFLSRKLADPETILHSVGVYTSSSEGDVLLFL